MLLFFSHDFYMFFSSSSHFCLLCVHLFQTAVNSYFGVIRDMFFVL